MDIGTCVIQTKNGPLGGDDELPDSRVDVTEGLYWVLMYSRRSLRV